MNNHREALKKFRSCLGNSVEIRYDGGDSFYCRLHDDVIFKDKDLQEPVGKLEGPLPEKIKPRSNWGPGWRLQTYKPRYQNKHDIVDKEASMYHWQSQ